MSIISYKLIYKHEICHNKAIQGTSRENMNWSIFLLWEKLCSQTLLQSLVVSSRRQKPILALPLHLADDWNQRSCFCQAYPHLPAKTGEQMYFFSVLASSEIQPYAFLTTSETAMCLNSISFSISFWCFGQESRRVETGRREDAQVIEIQICNSIIPGTGWYR